MRACTRPYSSPKRNDSSATLGSHGFAFGEEKKGERNLRVRRWPSIAIPEICPRYRLIAIDLHRAPRRTTPRHTRPRIKRTTIDRHGRKEIVNFFQAFEKCPNRNLYLLLFFGKQSRNFTVRAAINDPVWRAVTLTNHAPLCQDQSERTQEIMITTMREDRRAQSARYDRSLSSFLFSAGRPSGANTRVPLLTKTRKGTSNFQE